MARQAHDGVGVSFRVETRSGTILGESDAGASVWRGVPFAAPPVGKLRWKAPQRVTPWAGVRDTTRFGAVAPQLSARSAGGVPASSRRDEDCLTLNIWSPGAPSQLSGLGLRPVVVWFHGGAQIQGAGSMADYSGRALAVAGDLVVVTVNYRLGALGQLDLSTLGRRAGFDSNLGLRDQVAALEWVRDNIAEFGGDANRVTIMGESAGGTAITTLMALPAAAGLFRGAIAQSSAPTAVYSQESHAERAGEFLGLLGIAPGDEKRLREVPADALVAAGTELAGRNARERPGTLAFGPVVDGKYLPEHPIDVFAAGRAARVPLLIGTNRDEANLFVRSDPPILPVRETALREMLRMFVPESAPALVEAYGRLRRRGDRLGLSGDWSFTIPSLRVADGHARVAPTFMYRFDHATPATRAVGLGATHGTEIPFVFGNLGGPIGRLVLLLGGRRAAHELSRSMQEHWIAFIRSGNPGWERYGTDRTTRVFSTRTADRRHPAADRLPVWDGVGLHL
ncbi:MAG: carboxylesterase/lipase family protein [Mycetocola sp.]